MKPLKYVLLLVLTVVLMSSVSAQEIRDNPAIPVSCDTLVQGSFENNYEADNYAIELNPGDKLSVSVIPTGDQLRTGIFITGPTNLGVATTMGILGAERIENFKGDMPAQQPELTTGSLSAPGQYMIRVINFQLGFYRYENNQHTNMSRPGGIGIYTLRIGCVRSGSDGIPPLPAPAPLPPNFVGFPGLPPVDFARAIALPLIAGTPMSGAITPTGGEVFTFALDASGGTNLDLTLTRLSGNLNLGLVVLSADNQVIFQASLVTSQTLNMRFALPAAGQYTIGVFRVDLLAPTAPEAAAFQVLAALNP